VLTLFLRSSGLHLRDVLIINGRDLEAARGLWAARFGGTGPFAGEGRS